MIANDLSPTAVQAIKRNVVLNGLDGTPVEAGATGAATEIPEKMDSEPPPPDAPVVKESVTVRVNEGDAW